MAKMINGIIQEVFEKGWWGKNAEGKEFLERVSLSAFEIPFDVERYLTAQNMTIWTPQYEFITSFVRNDYRFEFYTSLNGKKFKQYLYREWDTEDLGLVIHLESYAVGEFTRNIMSGNIQKYKYLK